MFIYTGYSVLYILYSRSLVPDVLNLVSTSTARITAVCSREPRGTENDILRLWLRRLRVDPNRKTELKILKVAPSSYHKYRGTKKFVPGYPESDELLLELELIRRCHGGRMGSFEICYNFMEIECLCGDEKVCPPTFSIQK